MSRDYAPVMATLYAQHIELARQQQQIAALAARCAAQDDRITRLRRALAGS